MSAAVETSERLFVSTYLQLISLSLDAGATKFNNTPQSYSSLESLGPTLPATKAKLPSSSKQVELVNLTFKSIKPPYKFQTELTLIPNTESIFSVKSKLIDSLKLDLKPADLKFLVKGKVIQDNVILSSLENYNFMCMVSAPSASTAASTSSPEALTTEPAKDTSDPDMAIDERADLQVSSDAWDKIHSILKQDLRHEGRALTALEKFKSSI